MCSGRHAVKDRLKEVFLVTIVPTYQITLPRDKYQMIHILTYVYIFYFQLGYELDDEKLNAVFSLFRDLTKNKKVFNFYIFCISSCTCMQYGLTNKFNHIWYKNVRNELILKFQKRKSQTFILKKYLKLNVFSFVKIFRESRMLI